MKTSPLIALLVVSLAANAALVVSLRRPASGHATQPAASGARSYSSAASATDAADEESPITALRWQNFPTDDLPSLVASLRAQGFPPAVTRTIITTLVEKRFAERSKALRAAQEPPPYWQAGVIFSLGGDPQTRAALRELSREQAALVRQLLGTEADDTSSGIATAMRRRQYGDLTADKVQQVMAINSDYSDLTSQIRSESQGLLLPEDREKLAFLEAEKRKDLLTVLTPGEYEELQLRSSTTANMMRTQLVTLEPNEQEFRTIFRLQQAFDEQYGSTQRRNTPDWHAQRQAAERQLIADVTAALGDERGAEYERSRDPSYTQTYNVVTQLGLPKETALQVWTLQKDTLARASAIGSNSALSPQDRNAQLLALIEEASATLSSRLGENGLDTYKSTSGSWLRMMEQRATATARP